MKRDFSLRRLLAAAGLLLALLAELPAGERFLVEIPLAASAGEPDFSIADVRFYNAQGRDITDQYELGGSSF